MHSTVCRIATNILNKDTFKKPGLSKHFGDHVHAVKVTRVHAVQVTWIKQPNVILQLQVTQMKMSIAMKPWNPRTKMVKNEKRKKQKQI